MHPLLTQMAPGALVIQGNDALSVNKESLSMIRRRLDGRLFRFGAVAEVNVNISFIFRII